MCYYDNRLDDCTDITHAIYVSSSGEELPIVIETGTSNSITPNPKDFVWEIQRSNFSSLKQVKGTTPICGEGDVCWDIEDFYGTCRSILTETYYVPSATICLFSPQVYISSNSKTSLVLNRTGLQLILTCETILHFPISSSTNLLFIITQASLDKKRKLKINLKMSTIGTGIYSSGVVIHNNLI